MKSRNRLRVLRAEQDITQLTLARKARVNVTRVSFIENGLADAKPDEREKLAKALGVPVTDVFPLPAQESTERAS